MNVNTRNNFTNDLLSRADIVEIIGKHLAIKKQGANFIALCPFHDDNKPSLHLNAEKQIFKCFSCGVGGNVISFVSKYKKISFSQAIEEIATYYGLNFKAQNKKNDKTLVQTLDFLHKVADLYHSTLLSGIHLDILKYVKHRNLNLEIIKKFKIGFAPLSWNFIKDHFKNSISNLMLVNSGMIKQQDKKSYDVFRERLIFPIFNLQGQIIAFGGRAIGNHNLPKYLNSKDNDFFHKSYILYGLYQALKENINLQKLFVVEGYMDVLALNQVGIKNVVATLGTAITSSHIKLIFRYAEEIIMCLDGDMAGQNAAAKSLKIIMPHLKEGIQIKFIILKEGEDPDSIVQQKEGKQSFFTLYKKALSLSDYLFNRYYILKSEEPEAIALYTRKILEIINLMTSGLLKNLFLKKLEKYVQIDLALKTSDPTMSLNTEQSYIAPLHNIYKQNPQNSKITLSISQLDILSAAICNYPEIVVKLNDKFINRIEKFYLRSNLKGSVLFLKIIKVIKKETQLQSMSLPALIGFFDSSSYINEQEKKTLIKALDKINVIETKELINNSLKNIKQIVAEKASLHAKILQAKRKLKKPTYKLDSVEDNHLS